MKQLPLDSAPNTPPVWCSICGSALTDADRQGGLMACQCEGCREMMQERVRRRMGAEA